MKRSALYNLYRLCWEHPDLKVRRAATFLLIHGRTTCYPVGDADSYVLDALRDAGCEVVRDGTCDVAYCDGARECYTNEDLWPDEGGEDNFGAAA